jgi:hypothetical protein
MGTEVDRRAPYATRVPFDAMVEVGGALGPSFEAKAVNLSPDGMHLRTAYLPEVGQPVSCNFEVADAGMILVSGVVIWQEKSGDGGEFGIRFTNIDPESASHLKTLLAQARGEGPKAGSRVRLHIDGLASPMRGRVRGAESSGMTACSDLNFLQLGKPLDVEDAASGARRPAAIGGVQLEIDPETQVPQLIVSMRYADVMDAVAPPPAEDPAGATDNTSQAAAQSEPHAAARTNDEPAQAIPPPASDASEIEEESDKMKSAWAKKAQNVGPALNAWAKKTKDRLNDMLKKRREGAGDDVAVKATRRTTSPPPAGALHASGRRVVRSDLDESQVAPAKRRFKLGKRHAAVAGAVGVASILAIVAFRKPAEKPLVSAPPAETGAPEGTPAQTNPTPGQPGAATPQTATNGQPGSLPIASGNDAMDDEKGGKGKKGKVPPFTNGPVSHGNVLRMKMDGAIDKIQGAAQPTGFTVVIPNRKSEEAAAPLAARDSRIAGINVSNNPSGAELTVNFKDGVPNYMVRARGSYLEIVLAQGGGGSSKDESAPKQTAKKGHGKHGKH